MGKKETRGRKRSMLYASNHKKTICRILGEEEMKKVREAIGAKCNTSAVYMVLKKYLQEINKKNEQAK